MGLGSLGNLLRNLFLEMDLAPFAGVVFDTILFAFVFGISSAGAIFIWLFNRDGWKDSGSFKVLGQATPDRGQIPDWSPESWELLWA